MDATAKKTNQPVILQVIPELETGGAERGCVDMAKAIQKAGGLPVVASCGGRLVHELTKAGIRHVQLPLKSKNPFVIWKNISRLKKLIKEIGADIVHARSRAPAWSAYKAAQQLNVPYMTSFHSPYNFKGKLKRFYNSVMARGTRVIAVSHFIKKHITENYETNPDDIRVIQRGIDLNIFKPENVPPARFVQIAEKWRIPEDRKVIMLPGRLTRWKGPTVLLEAVAKLKEREDVICILVGSDQGRSGFKAELDQLVADLGIEHMVFFADHCDDMAAAYMLADVVVNNSLDPEAFGRVIVEAQAMGKPVIVTNHGAVRETIINGTTGWAVEPGDVDDLAETLSKALNLSVAERKDFAEAAVKHVAENFSKERMCFDTLNVYGEILSIDIKGDMKDPSFN